MKLFFFLELIVFVGLNEVKENKTINGEEDELNGAQPKEPNAPRQVSSSISFSIAAGHGKPAID